MVVDGLDVSSIYEDNAQALGNILILEKREKKKQSEGGIHIPDSAQRAYFTYKVKSVGKGLKGMDGRLIPPIVSPGDVVCVHNAGAVRSIKIETAEGEKEIYFMFEGDCVFFFPGAVDEGQV